jgi:hypothetical protein
MKSGFLRVGESDSGPYLYLCSKAPKYGSRLHFTTSATGPATAVEHHAAGAALAEVNTPVRGLAPWIRASGRPPRCMRSLSHGCEARGGFFQ